MWKSTLLICTVMLTALCGLQAALVINEVCYDNSTIADETGDTSSDWIELYNSGPDDININGYGVGDANPYKEAKGVRLPNYTIPAGGYLLLFANSDLPEYTVWTNAPDLAVIGENSDWKYWHASTAPASNWATQSYLDTAWQEGISPLGYNADKADLDCATVIGDTENPATLHTTAYFRHKFTILKTTTVSALLMQSRIKDGMVVYLNGTEVYRQNMPAGTISHTTFASVAISSQNWNTIALSTVPLVRGINTLAVEVHKAESSPNALIMDMNLITTINEQIPIVHGQFGLKKEGENAHLFNASLIRLHKCDHPGYEIGEDKSWGTILDGTTSSFKIYDQPTPGFSNSANQSKYTETLTAQTPFFSHTSGFYSSAQNITLSTSGIGYKIYYTLDGSDPRESSSYVWSGYSIAINAPASAIDGLAWRRTNPVETEQSVGGAGWLPPSDEVDRAVVLRAVTVSTDGLYCSPEQRATYFIGTRYQSRTLPIFSLITNEDALFGFSKGLYHPGKYYADSPEGYGSNKWGKPYANYHQENDDQQWEHPVYFELFEPHAQSAVLAATMGLTMHGGGTRTLPQKSLYLLARNTEYGTDYLNYQLFPDLPAQRYKRFLLRNSGNDWYGAASAGIATMLRDAVFHNIVSSLNIQYMAYRPALVYINGIYWGIHNQRESLDKHYLNSRYNLDPDNIDILMHVEEDNNDISIQRIDGSKSSDEEYEALLAWIDTNPPSLDANLTQLSTQVDLNNYTDYIIAETFFGNTDWPQNNCDFWRANSNQVDVAGEFGDQRWRWMFYDLDVAGEKGSDFNMFTYLTRDSMKDVDEAAFLINELWLNMNFRNNFVNRYTELLNTIFKPSVISNTINTAAMKIESEMTTHFSRWGRATTQIQWQNAIDADLIGYLTERHSNLWNHLDAHFILGGSGILTVMNSDPSGVGGHFKINNLDILQSTAGVDSVAQWSGRFFKSLPITVTAIPTEGYEFDGWVGSSVTTPTRVVFAADDYSVLKARFRVAGSEPYAATGYELWTLTNYTEQQINTTQAALPDEPSGYAGMSNFELYAFGMQRNDGLSDAQRIARASLSINALSDKLYVGFNRLNSNFADVSYKLRVTDNLHAPIVWRDALQGQELLPEIITNLINSSTWFQQQRLDQSVRPSLYLKLEVLQSPTD